MGYTIVFTGRYRVNTIEDTTQITDRVLHKLERASHITRHVLIRQGVKTRIDESVKCIQPAMSAMEKDFIRFMISAVGRIMTRFASLYIVDVIKDFAGPTGKPGVIRH